MTQHFRDNSDRNWIVAVHVGAIKTVRAALEIDLADPTPATMDRLAGDPVALVDVLWLLCAEQAKAAQVTAEQFGQSLVGDPIDAATDALLGAIADFFPGRRRSLLQLANAKMATVREKGEQLALARLNDPKLTADLEAAMTSRMDAEIQAALTRLSSPTT